MDHQDSQRLRLQIMSDVRWQPPKKPRHEQAILILLGTVIATVVTLVYALLLRTREIVNNYDAW